MIEESTPEDGRHARRRSNTRAITDAALTILGDGDELTGAAIAARSSVSVRSVFRHFESLDELVAAAATSFFDRHRHLVTFPFPPAGTSAVERIEQLVITRSSFFREGGAVLRALAANVGQYPGLRDTLERERLTTISHVQGLFAGEVAPLPAPIDLLTVASIDTATSFEIWDSFVTVHRLDADIADDVMRASCAVSLGIDPTGMHLERIGF